MNHTALVLQHSMVPKPSDLKKIVIEHEGEVVNYHGVLRQLKEKQDIQTVACLKDFKSLILYLQA